MRILPPHVFVVAILLIAAINLFSDSPRAIPGPYDWMIGVVLFVLGAALNLSSAWRFWLARTNILPHKDPIHLVTAGWFRYTRNPMYVGFVISLIGVAVGFGELAGFLVPPIFLFAMDRTFIQMEERNMRRVFGERYDEYRAKVRRWF
jgi:protein-S-isoprenylcysteine O-methyltransferase Ste14